MYTREQILEACTKYFNGDELAPDVFMKYALRDAPTSGQRVRPHRSQVS